MCISIGIGSVLLIPGTEIDPDMRNYVPSSIKSRIETDKIESEFGTQDLVLILFSDSCIIDPDNLSGGSEIDRSVSKLSGISSRVSPFTVNSIISSEGMMIVDPLIKRIPADTSRQDYWEEISLRTVSPVISSSHRI